MIIRDRISDMVAKKMTLEQVKAARPTLDYDGRYGSDTGPWTTAMFIEAIYQRPSSQQRRRQARDEQSLGMRQLSRRSSIAWRRHRPRRRRRRAARARRPGRSAADAAAARRPIDLTGTWVSVVTEDWRWRMVTPPKGDVASVPVNGEGRKAATAWDLDADNAAGNQCKAFGVGGIMRQPGRAADLVAGRLDAEAGVRRRHADAAAATSTAATQPGAGEDLAGLFASRTGKVPASAAVAEAPPGPGAGPAGSARARAAAGRACAAVRRRAGRRRSVAAATLKVVTTNFREGYLRKNGVPYSEQATITEYIHRLPTHPNGDDWLNVVTDRSRIRATCRSRSTRAPTSGSKPTTTKFAPTPVPNGAAAARQDEVGNPRPHALSSLASQF